MSRRLNYFRCFSIILTISTAFCALLDALNPTIPVYSDPVRGQTYGQRALLDQVRHNCRSCLEGLLFMFRFGVLYLCQSQEARCFSESGVSIFNTPIQRIQPDERRTSAQEPTKAYSRAFHNMIVVITRI